jgi:hypothetical protein
MDILNEIDNISSRNREWRVNHEAKIKAELEDYQSVKNQIAENVKVTDSLAIKIQNVEGKNLEHLEIIKKLEDTVASLTQDKEEQFSIINDLKLSNENKTNGMLFINIFKTMLYNI